MITIYLVDYFIEWLFSTEAKIARRVVWQPLSAIGTLILIFFLRGALPRYKIDGFIRLVWQSLIFILLIWISVILLILMS